MGRYLNHDNISYLKSALRIAGFSILFFEPAIGISLLIIAELLGIAEELV